jgi:hypothetical protein
MRIIIDKIMEINNLKLKSYPNKSIGILTIDRVKYYPSIKNIHIEPDGWEDAILFVADLCRNNNITIDELKEYVL